MPAFTRKYDLEEALLRIRIDAENAGLSFKDIADAFCDEAREARRTQREMTEDRIPPKPYRAPLSPFASTV